MILFDSFSHKIPSVNVIHQICSLFIKIVQERRRGYELEAQVFLYRSSICSSGSSGLLKWGMGRLAEGSIESGAASASK